MTDTSHLKLSKDLKAAVATLHINEVRFIVDTYYQRQDDRIRSQGQIRSIDQNKDDAPKSHDLLDWMNAHEVELEKQLKSCLEGFAKKHPIGKRMLAVTGVGGVIAAGLLAHLDIERAPTAGHFWNFAGLNPGIKWEKGQKRPFNAKLKVLCYKLGESFVKQQTRESAFYGKLFTERKAMEIKRNDEGYYADHAMNKEYKKTTEAYKWTHGYYPAGSCKEISLLKTETERAKFLRDNRQEPGEGQHMLPPAHIHSIARRWVVKLFLAHLHEIWYEDHYGKKAPEPYSIVHQGHAHKIEPQF